MMNIMRITVGVRFFLIVVPIVLPAALMTVYAQPAAEAIEENGKPGALDTSETALWTLRVSAQSIERACIIVGVSVTNMETLYSALVTLDEDHTPFLSDRLIGRPLWHVVVPDWRIELKSSGAAGGDRYSRTFDIYLDPVDGRVLKIKSRWPEGAVPFLTDLNAVSAAKQMKRSGNEVYHGFPTQDPKVSFVDALDSISRNGIDPLKARQIIGRYVMQSRMGRKPKAVWAITLRGVLPRPRHRRENSKPYSQHRYIVDAETGKWISASNTPDPKILWREDEKPGADPG